MKRRCNPRFIQQTHLKTASWRKAALELNELFGVNLPHLAWRDYATGRRDIVDAKARTALGLRVRPCPRCRHTPGMQIPRLLKRLSSGDLRQWKQMRLGGRYRAAGRFLEKVYRRKNNNHPARVGLGRKAAVSTETPRLPDHSKKNGGDE